jgi:hypothetical protein
MLGEIPQNTYRNEKGVVLTMMFTATNQPHNLGIHGNLI